ncbi:MAG: CoA transferase, partial [Gemmatimonadota bacterium]|nr:CoA transferase [Gemmatimonadota bacterium]
VVENFRPGALARRGLDAERLMAEHPALVWCTISGFGAGSSRPGYDFVVQAEAGWMAITGEPAGDPMKAGVALADVVAGKDAAIAILAALVARGRTGRGRRVDVSLAGSAAAALVNVAQNALVSGAEAGRWGNAHANLVPYELFHAADRPLVLAVGSDAQWRACAAALGLEALGAEASLAANAGRVAQRERIRAALAARLAERDAAHWLERLTAAGVPAGVVRTVGEVLAATPDASPLTGMPSSVNGVIKRPPPRLDEHGAGVRARGWGVFGEDAPPGVTSESPISSSGRDPRRG